MQEHTICDWDSSHLSTFELFHSSNISHLANYVPYNEDRHPKSRMTNFWEIIGLVTGLRGIYFRHYPKMAINGLSSHRVKLMFHARTRGLNGLKITQGVQRHYLHNWSTHARYIRVWIKCSVGCAWQAKFGQRQNRLCWLLRQEAWYWSKLHFRNYMGGICTYLNIHNGLPMLLTTRTKSIHPGKWKRATGDSRAQVASTHAVQQIITVGACVGTHQ